MAQRERVTDANKVPLGRPPPNYGTGAKPTGGLSLLKPSYLVPDGYESKPSYDKPSSQHQQTQAQHHPQSQHLHQLPQHQHHQPPPHYHQQQQSVYLPAQYQPPLPTTPAPPLPSQPPPTSFSGQINHLNSGSSSKNSTPDYSRWNESPAGFQFSAGSSFSSPSTAVAIMKRENDDSNDSGAAEERGRERKRKRRSRWMGNENEKAVIPGMPTILPSDLPPEQQEAYIAQLQIEELTRKLRTGDLGIPPNPEDRSPSPEPIYGTDGKRLNTREYRTRKKLEEERHRLIQRLLKLNPEYKAPADYRAPIVKIVDRVSIPQEEHPEINFVGLLIGPRGNTLKGLEKDTGAKIIIHGKGSVKEGKVGGKAGHPLPGEDEPLHAYVTSNNPESVKKACDKIRDIIRQGIDMPESQNDLRKNQLRELALLNGTLREGEGPKCSNCGATNHRTWHCPDKPNITNSVICTVCGGAGHIAKDCRMKRPGAGGPPTINPNEKAKIDEEYMSLMAELGEGPPSKEGGGGGGGKTFTMSSTPNLFGRASAPKALMGSQSGSGGHGHGPLSHGPPGHGHGPQSHGHGPSPPGHGPGGGHGHGHGPSNHGWNNSNQGHMQGDSNKGPQPPSHQMKPPQNSWGYPPAPPPPSSSYPQSYSGQQQQQQWAGWTPPPPPAPGAQPPPPGMYWQQGGMAYGMTPPPPPPPEKNQPPPPPPM